MDLINELRARIDDLGISQAEAARRMGVVPQRLNNILARRISPSADVISHALTVLGPPRLKWPRGQHAKKSV